MTTNIDMNSASIGILRKQMDVEFKFDEDNIVSSCHSPFSQLFLLRVSELAQQEVLDVGCPPSPPPLFFLGGLGQVESASLASE